MKIKSVLAALFASALVSGAMAQAPKAPPAKAPADVAYDSYAKIYGDKEAKLSQERFKQVIDAGIDYLIKYPTHWRANNVIREVGFFGDSIRDKKLAAYRAAYVTQLKFEVVNARYKPDVTDDGKAALTALEVTAIDFETRDAPSRDAVNNLREKIDNLAAMPGGTRYLPDREKSYVEILTRGISPAAGEAHLAKLLKHTDKAVVAMARTEMNLVELRKAPYDLKFTALDGKAVDVAALRGNGKVVMLVFWSGQSEGTGNMIGQVQQAQSFYKKNVEVIGVSLDKEADREKVAKFIKEQKITWPVHFDGKETKTEWIGKLNVTKAPAIVVFDKKGIFVRNNQAANQLEGELKRLIDAK